MLESFDPYLSWLGIRDPERPPNHYRLLGVATFEDDPEVLAHAADRQMSHVRTFQRGRHSAESQRLLNELAAAKVCLLNPAKKVDYDAALRAKEAAASAPPPAVPPPLPVPLPVDAPAAAGPLEALRAPPPPEYPSDPGASLRPGAWVPPAAAVPAPTPVAARSSATLVTVAIVVLAVLAVVLGGLIVALKNPEFRAKLGLGGTPQDELPAAGNDGAEGPEPEPKTEEETEPAVEPKTEPKTKTGDEAKPEPKPPKVKPEAPKPPVWVDASKQGIRCGDVEVRIASAVVAWPQLLRDGEKTQATEPRLLVTVSLQNAGAAPVPYAGWAAAGEDGQAAAIVDNLNTSYALKPFPGATIDGQLGKADLAAGGTATDVLPFDPPAEDAEIAHLRLPLPASALGQPGTLHFEIPTSMLAREPPPAAEPKTTVDPRLEAPADEDVQKALDRIRELFADDFRSPAPAQRRALLKKLLGAARTEADPTVRYALLCEACDQAIAAGEAGSFREALRQLGRQYRTDTLLRAIETLQGTLQPSPKRPRSNEAYKAAAALGMDLARTAAAQERYDAARELADLAWKIASKYGSDTKDYIPKKETAELKKEVAVWQQRYDAFRAAEAALVQRPDDPAANLTCGLYCVAVRGDWPAALPLLAEGKDPELQKLAAEDLAAPADPAAMVALGDGWWALGGQKDDPLRRALRLRAKLWYDKALPGLSGLDREAVLKRLKDAEAIGIK